MSLSSAVGWWEEWQLRILVLSSLFIQYILYFSVWLRWNPNLRRLRVLVWIAYIGSDAVAIYALATLFNRQKKTWDGGRSSAMELLWAPVLLIQLGGQPFITAYSLDDNELWKRHTVTLVSQVTVALYVFCKWWSGEKIILAAAILLFVVGILKFAQKPWALRIASFNNMLASGNVLRLEDAQGLRSYSSIEEYVQVAKKCLMDTKVDGQYSYDGWSHYMFVDLSIPYTFRVKSLQYFLMRCLDYKDGHRALQESLEVTFDMLYTRHGSMFTPLGIGSMLLLPSLTLASTVLFATSHKEGQNEKDILVTYILFGCTTLLEFLLPIMLICSLFPCCTNFLYKCREGWHNMVSQYNLISFCVRKKNPTFRMKLPTFNFIRYFMNQHWHVQHVPIAFHITWVVRQHLQDGWKKHIHDAASYRRVSELRGQLAIRRHHQLAWSLKMPYDESILIWHVATDLCFYHPNTSPQCRQQEATRCSRAISNYMVYLLHIRPEMLMTGTRSDLFTMASSIIMEITKGSYDADEEMLAQEILNVPIDHSAFNIVYDACNLTKALMELGDEKERWIVLQGVWVEMLCYSASRCRGYLHAKSLGEGGEYLSIVWLLWSFLGMQTLADMHQRSEPPQEEGGEGEAIASTSPSLGRTGHSEDNFSPV